MTFRPILAILLPAILAACSSGNSDNAIVTIDIAGNVGTSDKGSLNDFFEFESLIRPELTDTTLLAYAPVHGRHGNRLYIQEDDDHLYTFDATTGKSLSSFSRKGNGPEDWNLLYFAYPAKNGDWVAYDLRGQKILRYTADGGFIGKYPAHICNICPNDDGWAAPKEVADGEDQVIYLYDDNFTLKDSIPTHITRHYMVSNNMEPFEGRASMIADDTLYVVNAVSDSHTFAPQMAFNLGQYRCTYNTEEEFDKLIAERHRFIWYEAKTIGNFVAVDYRFEKKNTLQIYDRNNGALLYSCTVDPEDKTGVTHGGFPYDIDGQTYGITPMGIASDGSIFFTIFTEQFDEEEGNPAILTLRPKQSNLI